MNKTTSFKKCVLAGATLFAMTFASVSHATNPAPKIKADAPNRYTVKQGDTLWNLSGRYLHNPSRWKDIWATNQHIKNPNLIYPNDTLVMCIIKGKAMVGVDNGEGCTGVEKQVKAKEEGTAREIVPRAVRVTSVANSIPVIPIQSIRYWLDRVMIVNPLDFKETPYVLASKNRNLITAKGDIIYARGVALRIGETYGIYREGEPFIDGSTKRVTGIETTQVAKGIVKDVSGNGVSSIQLVETFDTEVREGDRVFADIGMGLPPAFNLRPARTKRPGRIVRVRGSVGMAAGAGNVVAINLGKTAGARAGDVLTVYRRGPLIRDVMDNDMPVRLPSEPSGRVLVFRVFNNISYAYILDSDVPLAVGDQLLPPPNL